MAMLNNQRVFGLLHPSPSISPPCPAISRDQTWQWNIPELKMAISQLASSSLHAHARAWPPVPAGNALEIDEKRQSLGAIDLPLFNVIFHGAFSKGGFYQKLMGGLVTLCPQIGELTN